MTPLAAAAKVSSRPKEYPDWKKLIDASAAWRNRRPGARGRALIATNIGGHGPAAMMEATLAAALAVRDMDVEIVLCDGVMPGCLRAEFTDIPDPKILVERRLPEVLCPSCIWRGRTMFEPLGLKVHFLSELATEEDRAEAKRIAESIPAGDIGTFELEGLKVGEHARAGALRYFARGDFSGEPAGEAVLRRYLEGGLVATRAYQRLLTSRKFDVAVFHHGLYVPQGQVGEVCRQLGVRVVNWFVAYRKNSFIGSHGDTYHHTLMDEPTSVWETMNWGPQQKQDIETYLKSRWHGSRDWIGFHEKPTEDVVAYAQSVGLDLDKPIIGLLTNVVWDAQLHYPANAYPSLLDWLFDTIEYFKSRPDLQLVIRIHPAEIRGTVPSRQPAAAEIARRFPQLPPNVFVVAPENPISTYALMALCDSVLIYGTKTGVELTSVGIPTVVAGEAWIKNKGLTLDARNAQEYRAILDTLPLRKRLEADVVERAQKYAYHFFFRRMIPVGLMKATANNIFYKPDITSMDDLLPGKSAGLDVICDGITDQTPFVYHAEQLGVHDGGASPEPARQEPPAGKAKTPEKLTVAVNTLINPGNAGGSESSALSIVTSFRDHGPAEIETIVTALPRFADAMRKIRGDASKVIEWPWQEFTPVSSAPKSPGLKAIRSWLGKGQLAKGFDAWMRSRNEREFLRTMPTRSHVDALLDRYKVDVVHFTYPVKWPTRRPYIFEPHDIQHHHFPEFFSDDVLSWRYRAYGEGIRNAAFVVCGTWWTKRDIMKHYGVDASRVAVIPRSSVMGRLALDPQQEAGVVAQAGLPEVFAYYPAMTFPHKNHLRLFEAMALLRDRDGIEVSLVCSGRHYKPFHPELVAAVRRLKLDNQVKFLGSVSEELLTACYQRARLIVFPSLLEGLSQSLLESLSHRKPIVAANQSSIPETIGDAGILFDGLSVEALAQALGRVWSDAGLRNELIARTDMSFDRYSWDKAIVTLTACYKNAAGRALSAQENAALARALREYQPD